MADAESEGVQRVVLSSQVLQFCWTHALSTDKEEIMGLLIGRKEGADIKYVTVKALRRVTREKDRVEIAPDQLCKGAEFAEKLKDENGVSLRVLGWYHSHPRITVHPSAVDLRTQASYQNMDATFVGLIFSVFDFNAKTMTERNDMIAFQVNTSENPPACTYLKVFVDEYVSLMTKQIFVSIFQAMEELWETMRIEIREEYEQTKAAGMGGEVAGINNCAQYLQRLAQLIEFHKEPAIEIAQYQQMNQQIVAHHESLLKRWQEEEKEVTSESEDDDLPDVGIDGLAKAGNRVQAGLDVGVSSGKSDKRIESGSQEF